MNCDLLITRELWMNLIMNNYEVITIVLQALTLIATIAISVVLYLLNNKQKEKENRLKNEQLAKAFIIDNSDINDYIPICIIASALNRHKNHHRELYNKFNKLSDDVQKEVIKQCNYDIDLIKGTEWVAKSIDYVNKFLNDNDLGNGCNNYLYDNGKYLHYAIRQYADKEYDGRCYNKKYKNPFPSKKIGFQGDKCLEYLIDFDNYCDDYMLYVKRSIREDFKIYKSERIAPKPIKYLEIVENLPCVTNEEVCYWVLDFVNFFSIYIINTMSSGYPSEYISDAKIETYEDKYYDVMISLYLLYALIICKTK